MSRGLPALLLLGLSAGCGDPPARSAGPARPVPDWAEVLASEPDPEVVRDPDARARIAATGLPWHVRHRASGVELLLLPPGEYRRGASPSDPEALEDERPPHPVRVTRPFYLGRFELTQEEWRRVTGSDAGHFRGDPRRPVESVDRFTIEAFLAATSLELPTEAQWEYACRAGDESARHGPLEEVAWCRANAGMRPHAVGGKAANAFGFHDMLGNVWEWTASPYIQDEYGRYAERGVAAEYRPRAGLGVVLRGGSWYDPEKRLRASARYAVEWPFASGHVGLRAARSVEPVRDPPERDGGR